MKNKSLLFIVSLIALILVNVSEVRAQRWDDWRFWWKLSSSEEYDDTRALNVGIVFPTFSTSHYKIEKSNNWNRLGAQMATKGEFSTISTKSGFEVGVGIPIRLRLNHYLSLLSGVYVPNLIHSNSLEYSNPEPDGLGLKFDYLNSPSDFKMQRTVQGGVSPIGENNFKKWEIPVQLQLRSDYKFINENYNNTLSKYRLYLVGGGKYVRHYSANNYYNNNTNEIPASNPPLIVKPDYFSLDVGLGLDLYFTYFKLSPEIRFSESLGNLLDHSKDHVLMNNLTGYHNPYMNALQRLALRSVQFSIILE